MYCNNADFNGSLAGIRSIDRIGGIFRAILFENSNFFGGAFRSTERRKKSKSKRERQAYM